MKLQTIQTKLETADREEIAIILNDKAITVGANQTADYIGIALENIESAKERIKNAISELQELKKTLESQEDIIKIGVSEWLTENGVDKLQGDRISSITVLDKKETKELVVDNEEAIINAGYFKMTIDKTAAKQAILNGVVFEGAHIEVTYNEPSIRLNRRKKKSDENNS